MKEQTLPRAHLLNKFDELPVKGNAVADWQTMEKALQIAMPIGFLSFVLFGKGWLLSKKLMWILITAATCGGAATTLAVYQSREASLAQATADQQNKPDRNTTASLAKVPVLNDTVRIIKKRKIKKVLPNSVDTSAPKLKRTALPDSLAWPKRKLMRVRTVRVISARPVKNLRPARILMDTTVRLRKSLRPARIVFADSSFRLKRNLKNARIAFTDTSFRLQKNLKNARVAFSDTSFKLRKNLKNARVAFSDTSFRLQKNFKPLRALKDTLSGIRKNIRSMSVLKDTSIRLRKNIRPVRALKDTLIRQVKRPNNRPVITDTIIRVRKVKPSVSN